jgi:hypothetical protein
MKYYNYFILTPLLILNTFCSCNKPNSGTPLLLLPPPLLLSRQQLMVFYGKLRSSFFMPMTNYNMLDGISGDTTLEFDGSFAGTGTFQLTKGKNGGYFSTNSSSSENSVYWFYDNSGASLTITQYSNNMMSGTFSFTGVNSANDTIRITNGTFENVPFTN